MHAKIQLLKMINHLFPLPAHPFNMQERCEKSYAAWQYEKGGETIRRYLKYTSVPDMLKGKTVLDVGCGAGGKALYYASQGAKKVIGIDVVEKYRGEALALAESLGIQNFEFHTYNAARTPFGAHTFDAAMMNDVMEHVSEPEAVLSEMYRILKPGGRLYINFPPYMHPFGAHLSDAIGIPWVHAFFSDTTLIAAYKELVVDKPDGLERIRFCIGTDGSGRAYFSYINKMTVKRFNAIKNNAGFAVGYYEEVPLRKALRPLCIGPLREYLTKTVVCVLERRADTR